MFPDDIKDLYQGIAFDELGFQCVYCQLEFLKSESVDDLIDFVGKSISGHKVSWDCFWC